MSTLLPQAEKWQLAAGAMGCLLWPPLPRIAATQSADMPVWPTSRR
jgi:hypothetical protein